MRKLKQLLFAAAVLPLVSSAENLLTGDTGAEAGIEYLTIGGEGIGILPMFQDNTQAYEGKSSVRVDWDKKRRFGNVDHHYFGQYMGINLPETMESGATYTISFYAKATSDNYPLGVHLFSNAGWSKASSYYLSTKLSKEWKRYSFTFKVNAGKNAFTSAYSLNLFFSKNKNVPAGSVWFDAFQLEKGTKATPYVSGRAVAAELQLKSEKNMHIMGKGDRITAQLNAVKVADCGKTELELSVLDWEGKIVKKYSVPFDSKLKQNFVLPTDRYGWFLVRAKFSSGNLIVAETEKTYTVLRPPVKIQPGIRPYMGVIASNLYSDKDYAANRAMGASRIQVNFIDHGTGPVDKVFIAPGKFDWAPVDFAVAAARRNNLTIKLDISPFDWPDWYFPKEIAAMKRFHRHRHPLLTMEHRKMWNDFINTIADRYGKYVETFDLGSEDNGRLGINPYYMKKYPEGVLKEKRGAAYLAAGPAFDTLCTLVSDASLTLQKRYPKARVAAIRPSMGRPGDEWLFVWKMFEKMGKNFNAFSIDTYSLQPYYINSKIAPKAQRTGGGPDGRFITMQYAKDMIKKYGCNQDVFMSEAGIALYRNEPELSEERREEAHFVVRDMLSAKCAGFSSFDLFEGINGFPGTTGLGWDANSPKGLHIRAAAYSTLAQFIENVTETKWVVPDNVTRMAFLKKYNKTGICVVWAQKGYSLHVPAGIKVYDFMGNEFNLPKNRILKLDEFPQYLTYPDYAKLVGKLQKPAIEQTDFCKVQFRRITDTQGLLKFTNNSNLYPLSLEYKVKSVNGKTQTGEIDIPQASWSTERLNIAENTKVINLQYRKINGKSYIPVKLELPSVTAIAYGNKPVSNMGFVENKNAILPNEPWTPWNGTKDLHVALRGSWDQTALHLNVTVQDDIHQPSKNLNAPWNGDSLQIAVDPKNNGAFYERVPGRMLDSDDMECAFWITPDGKNHKLASFGKPELIKAIQYNIVRNEKAGTTVYTIDIPWNQLGVKPVKGMVFGLSAVIFDDDSGNGQEYYGFIGSGITVMKNPMKYKKFVLK